MDVQIYDVEVDVAVARPPTPANTRTIFVRVAVPLDLPNFVADTEATLIEEHGNCRRVGLGSPARRRGDAKPGRVRVEPLPSTLFRTPVRRTLRGPGRPE